jgi:serine/threonine-protein phosphatase 2A regulatory subunit B
LCLVVFEEPSEESAKTFFTEIITSVADVKFSSDGRYIFSRDYMNLKIWDVNMEKKPVKTIPIHEHLQGKICELYENDFIFDKFECTVSGDGKYVSCQSPWFCTSASFMTLIYPLFYFLKFLHGFSRWALSGSYNNFFQIHSTDVADSQPIHLQADKSAFKAKKTGSKNKSSAAVRRPTTDLTIQDYHRKILHSSWHPRENSIAVAATNNLFIFSTL